MNGEDYISAHSDQEQDLSDVGVVALSFGTPRTFRIRGKGDKDGFRSRKPRGFGLWPKSVKIIVDYPTEHNSLLWMKGDFQKYFTHEIPIQKEITTARLSVTFRYHRK